MANIIEGEDRIILATGRGLWEGFDDTGLDILFLSLPVFLRSIFIQYAGRLHRIHKGKKEVRIFDYADMDIPMLAKMYGRCRRGYLSIGY